MRLTQRAMMRAGQLTWATMWAAGLVALILALAACGSTGAPASNGPPRTVGTGPNSHVHLLQVLPKGDLLLGDQEGLWRGDPNGRAWRPTGPPLNRMMPTCLARTGTVELACTTTYSSNFLGSPRGVWRMVNNGRRWRRSPLPDLDVTYLSTNVDLPRTVVAYARADGLTGGPGHGGIWVSRNAGATWKRVNAKFAGSNLPIGLALLPGRPLTIIFAETTGLHISHDGGITWRINRLSNSTVLALSVSQADPTIAFASGVSLPSTKGRIWEGTNSGSTWSRLWRVPPTSLLATSGGWAGGCTATPAAPNL